MIAGILLAAGTSRRFGNDKLQQRLSDGRGIAMTAAAHLKKAIEYCIAVVPAGNRELHTLFDALDLRVVRAPVRDIGMGTSLACGVRALPAVEGFVVALADMPFIRPATIETVARTLAEGARIAAPRYRERRGHPIGFNCRWRETVESLSGDIGARSILARHAEEIVWIDCNDAGISIDIDEPQDLYRVPAADIPSLLPLD